MRRLGVKAVDIVRFAALRGVAAHEGLNPAHEGLATCLKILALAAHEGRKPDRLELAHEGRNLPPMKAEGATMNTQELQALELRLMALLARCDPDTVAGVDIRDTLFDLGSALALAEERASELEARLRNQPTNP